MARSTNPLGLTDYQWQLLRWSADPASTWREYGQLFTTGGNPGTLKALYRHELIEEGLYRRDPAQRQALETMIRDSLIQAAEELPGGDWRRALRLLQQVSSEDHELRRKTLWLTPKALALVEEHQPTKEH